ncbi:hypothetical protein [Streptomyces sp. NPDC007264]|uniref:hypothetical protein n=1 Tax=Streptomyces sp. NPDC007264 TaxID=3364777 RepID=UPI0036DDFEA4
MAQERAGSAAAAWSVLVLIGLIGNAIGLIGGVPVITLAAAPLTIIGLIGLTATRRRQQS